MLRFALVALVFLVAACGGRTNTVPCAHCDAKSAAVAAKPGQPAAASPLALLVDTQDFPPRWHCGTWTSAHGWTHVLADLVIWLSYMAIPAGLIALVRRRRDVPFQGVFVLFGAFIVCCGLTHLLEAMMFWWPAYRVMGLVKVVTALVSLATVVALVRVMPRVLLLRSPAQLEVEVRERTADAVRAREAAQWAAQARARFTANVSHEMRTPLTAVLGHADLLADSSAMTERQREHIEAIQRNSTHLLAVINDVLDLSRGEAGMLAIVKETCRIEEIVADCVGMLAGRAERKGIALTVAVSGEPLPAVEADAVRLRQVLINVIGNAIKFTDRGGVHVTVSAAPGEAAESLQCRIDVRDCGIGMTAEQAAHAFDEFTQADPSLTRRHGGSGLGLTISRQLAVAMGGALEIVETAIGSGTTVRFTFPAALSQAAAKPVAEQHSVDLAGVRVLLVEDAEDSRHLLHSVLSRAGADVTSADNGLDAVRAATQARGSGSPFDLILMDVQMPAMDGLTATRALRAAGHDERILTLTAHATEEDRIQSQAAGCDGHLTKPIRPAELLRAVAETCRAGRGDGAGPGAALRS